MNNKQIIINYLDAFSSGDQDTARSYIADDIVFQGPILQAEGKDAFWEGAAPALAFARGYTMLRQFEEGDDVCSIYEFKVESPAGKGDVLMTEWNTIKNGQIASAKLVFDTAEFMKLMPA